MYSSEDCFACNHLKLLNKEEAEIRRDHDRCHGWYHCVDCCGACVFCGQEGESYGDEYSRD